MSTLSEREDELDIVDIFRFTEKFCYEMSDNLLFKKEYSAFL